MKNSSQFIGNIGQPGQIKENNGEKFISFTVAVNEKYTRNGVEVDKTQWISCSASFQRYENLLPYLTKGKQVGVYGSVSANAYTDKEGNLRAGLNLRVREIQLIGSQKYDIVNGDIIDNATGEVIGKTNAKIKAYLNSLNGQPTEAQTPPPAPEPQAATQTAENADSSEDDLPF